MPGLDGTGPMGAGPMTGGGRGNCMTDEPATVERFVRRGLALGRGWRRGAPRGMRAGRGFGAGGGRRWWR